MNYSVRLPISVVEVSAGEYGHEFIDRMVEQIDNGKCICWTPDGIAQVDEIDDSVAEPTWNIKDELLRAGGSTAWQQFWILYKRRTLQMFRDSVRNECNVFTNILQ